MPDELQGLLDRITEEGLKKAELERDDVLRKAKTEAKRRVDEARAESEKLLAEAKRESALLAETTRLALKQAARDVLLSLGAQLQERMRAVLKAAVGEALTPEGMASIIVEMAKAYAKDHGAVESVALRLGRRDRAATEERLLALLKADLAAKPEVRPVPDGDAGFKLAFNGEDVVYDFSDQALAEALATFLSPKLAALVRGGKDD